MTKEKRETAIAVEHKGATIPRPSKQMIIEMARGIHLAVAGMAAVERNEDASAFPDWEKLPDGVKEYWLEGARCAYAIIAIHGGGKVRKLDAE